MSYTQLDQQFFGRDDILELLKRRVVDLKEGYRQNIALVGSPYIGKSAVLDYFLYNLDDSDVNIIYLDLDNKDFQYFFSKFTGSLLYNFSRNSNLPLHDDLNLLLESTKNVIPHTVAVIHKIRENVEKGKHKDAFLGLFTLPEVFTNETGKFCVMILDEFQNIENFLLPNAFADLGKKIMTQKKCFYIVSSSYPSLAKKILTEKLSLLFGNFEVAECKPFDLETSQKFIEHNLKDHTTLGVHFQNFLADFCGGHPLYIRLICQELNNLSAVYRQSEIYLPLLSHAVENTLFDRWGVISRHFELIVQEISAGKGNQSMISILMAISQGKNKSDEIFETLNLKKTYLQQRLQRLMEMGIIVKNGNFHYFKDKLFKYWIKYVYQVRMMDVEFAPDKQRKRFKDEFQLNIDNFKITARKDFSSRIIDLFNCFDNEAFDLNGRKYKLPTFEELVPFKLKGDAGGYFDVIKASTQESVWFVVLKKDVLSEGEVSTVVAEARKIDKKPERCLIISLTDLDENAKLKALQERFWIWNENELNDLLTLFEKPYIVR